MTGPCTRCRTPLEDGDLRCAVCALPVPRALEPTQHVRVQILRCTNCNAAIGFDPNARAPKCGFCSSTMQIEEPVDPVETAALRVPFGVPREAAVESVRDWLGKRGFFAPKALRDEAVLDTLQPLCWAAWIVDAQAQVAWTADSDAGSHRSAWAPHSGVAQLRFDAICVPATRGLDLEEARELTPYYELSRAVAVGAPGIPGETPAMIESFDAQRSAARRQVQRAIEATAKTRVEAFIPGRRYRNIHAACMLEGMTTHRVALPAWVVTYRYRDAVWRAIVHGQRRDVVVGKSPTDWAKVAVVVLISAVVLAAIAALILLTRK
ncbi:MAG: zinc ribbon domain-containing protein [Deltaproteobacteria bacterium]|nr:zinc ribbon domain-containing protein [Deltaproteobacteria bacterium]